MATNNTSKKRRQQKRQAIIRLVVMAAILICLNMLATRFHLGLDLTKEKKFTLTEATENVLREMDDVAVITVYLEGSFPAGFQRLKEGTREKLQTMRQIAGSNIRYRFVNPLEGVDEEAKPEVYKSLAQKGVFAVNLQMQGEDDGYTEKFVFPYALVQYKGRERAVRLLEDKLGLKALDNLNYAESLLEYKLASVIHALEQPEKPEVAYLVGHDEALGMSTFDLFRTLDEYYNVDTFDLVNNIYIPKTYDAVILNRPQQAFEDKDKFKIDQYIMNGGHVLWVVDQLHTPMDSLQINGQFIALEYGLNLDDQLFKYGVRINTDLVEERQCLPMPIIVGQQANDQPQMQLRPWMYFPVFIPETSHPIVKNLDGIMGMYVNTIDTIGNPEVEKTILLQSTKYSRKSSAPARISLSMLQYPLDQLFKEPRKQLPVAVLLEGEFKSVFNRRIHPNFLKILKDSLNMAFKPACDTTTSMIVVADGDMFQNDFSSKTGPMEMGFWRFTETRFANKTFLLNCLEYMTDNSGLLAARTKDTKLRLLDENRIKREEQTWQFVNIGIPIALVLMFASVYIFFRKRKYEKPVAKKGQEGKRNA